MRAAVNENPANLKLAYTTIVRSERSLSATAPKSLRGNRLRVFSFIAKGKASAKPIKVVKAYLRGTCHIAV